MAAIMGQVAGLSAGQLSLVRGRLEDFAAEMFEPLVRTISVAGARCISAG